MIRMNAKVTINNKEIQRTYLKIFLMNAKFNIIKKMFLRILYSKKMLNKLIKYKQIMKTNKMKVNSFQFLMY